MILQQYKKKFKNLKNKNVIISKNKKNFLITVRKKTPKINPLLIHFFCCICFFFLCESIFFSFENELFFEHKEKQIEIENIKGLDEIEEEIKKFLSNNDETNKNNAWVTVENVLICILIIGISYGCYHVYYYGFPSLWDEPTSNRLDIKTRNTPNILTPLSWDMIIKSLSELQLSMFNDEKTYKYIMKLCYRCHSNPDLSPIVLTFLNDILKNIQYNKINVGDKETTIKTLSYIIAELKITSATVFTKL